MNITETTSPEPDEQLLSAAAVREHCGNVSDMTIWRWQQERGFPKPYMKVGQRNFWRYGDVREWIAERHAETLAARKMEAA